jgi:hypothetical protein
VSPDLMKRFADCQFGDEFRGRVKSGWILILDYAARIGVNQPNHVI